MALYCRLFAPRPFLYIIVCNSASTLCFVRYLVDIIDMTDSEQNANLVLNCTWVSFFFPRGHATVALPGVSLDRVSLVMLHMGIFQSALPLIDVQCMCSLISARW